MLISVLTLTGCGNDSEKENQIAKSEENYQSDNSEDTGEMTPEEALQRLNEEEGIGKEQGPVSVSIVSPKEETFMPRQARMYKAEVEGMERGFRCECKWKFYLNERGEEVLYREMESPCVNNSCGFTSTFIEKIGKLRVHVDVDVKNSKKGTVYSTSTDREYLVN